MKYKIGDEIIVTKASSSAISDYTIGKIGIIADICNRDSFPYKIIFKEQIDFRYDKSEKGAYWFLYVENQLMSLNEWKLNKLLKDK